MAFAREDSVQRAMLEGATYVGLHVTLSRAGCRHRGSGRAAARSHQYDAGRFAEPLAKTYAPARATAIHRDHRDYGNDLGNGSLNYENAARSLHWSCAHILFFLLRLFRLFLLGRGIIGGGGFGGMTLTSASLRGRGGRQCQKCGGNSNRQNTHERHPIF